jgi:hypothetical protein
MKEYQLTPITETAEQAIATESQNGKIAEQILLGGLRSVAAVFYKTTLLIFRG